MTAPALAQPAVAGGPRSWTRAVTAGLSIWGACTAGYLALAAVVQALGLDPHRYPTSPVLSWPFRLFARGDAGHFLSIARYGYFGHYSGPLTAAYFPGYPLAGRTLARLVSVGQPSVTTYLVALSLVAWLGTAITAVLLWRLAEDLAGPTVATASVVALLAGPYSVFLVSSYSEGPFLALALGAWVAARSDRWTLACGLASAAAFTRISGLFLGCALVVLYVRGRRLDPRAGLLAAPFLTVLGYFGWLHHRTGSWTTWFDVERLGWGRHTVSPITSFTHSVHRLFSAHDPSTWQLVSVRFQDAMELVFAAVYVVAIVVLARRRRWPEVTYVGLTAASLLTSAWYLSVPRSMLVCFPIWIMVGEAAVHRRGRWCYGLAAVSVLISVFEVVSMLSDHWAG